MAGRAQGATEVLKASLAGAERARGACCKTALEKCGEAGHGRNFRFYYKDNGKLLKHFKQGGEIRFAFLKHHPDGSKNNRLEGSQIDVGQPWQPGRI